MRVFKHFQKTLLAGVGVLALAACTQGENIESPGATNPGTPPGGGNNGGGNNGGGNGNTAECPTGFTTGTSVGGLTVCNISGSILGDLTLPYVSGVAYQLNGRVDVGIDVGADGATPGGSAGTLTIEPGVTVFGASGADYLVVNRGSRLVADGTQDAPIIFTSENDIERRAVDASDTGGSNISEWGGVVVLGQAPISRCQTAATPGTDQCTNVVEGVTSPEASYGGSDANDDSGIIRYAQIRFAGFAINQQGNELNGLTLAGVGDGTTIENVQVHNNSDDGIEMFGGTANLKYIVLTGNDDDSLDTDNGWTGNVQYLAIKQRDDGGDNGFEMSSTLDGADNPVVPQTNPTIANFTVVGGRSNAFRINTGHIGRFLNGVVAYDTNCFRWQDSAGDTDPSSYSGLTDPTFNSVLFDCAALTDASPDVPAAVDSVNADANNVVGASSLTSMMFPGPNEQGVTAFDLTTLPGSFFEDTDYIGAFSPMESETNNWAAGWTFALFPAPSCPTGTTRTGEIDGKNVCAVAGVQTEDLTLTRGNYYELEGRVDIGVDVGADGTAPNGDVAVLTIEPGAVIFGNSGADYLVVNRGSQIFSNGTRQNPVIFTSQADLEDTQADPENAISEWGGIVVLGDAPISRCQTAATPGTNQCTNVVEGVTNPEASYGGSDATDSSGSIRYTQIKHAGFAINQQGNELNGLTMAGVGSGTTIEYVQVHNNSDDGIEMFGGTANLKNIVLTGNDDDSLDTDNGWTGNLQYLIITQRATGGDNAFEMSSTLDVADNPVTPQTNPTIANFTVVGARSNAFRINTGHIGRFLNGVVAYDSSCLRWEDTAGDTDPSSYSGLTDPTFNSVLFDCVSLTNASPDTPAAVDSVNADANNSTNVSNSLINVFINGPNEAAATAFDLTTLGDPFFEDTDYIGAVKDANDRWWADWSCGLEASTPC
ncbi:hypothetical protein [Hyphococcus sp. DH-69]|uniref:hypothetical protein n=1 Tax=Hyphococcus formosus TaxID=3143534 RepID=UPI00398ADEDD